MKNWVEISGERLVANYRTLSAVAGEKISVLAVVKADAYGHGAELCAPVLAAAGVEWLGVTDAIEGANVRSVLTEAGIPVDRQPAVLVMSEPLAEDAGAILQHRLTPVVSSIEQIKCFASAPQPSAVHLEIDTGMSRQGVAVGEALDRVLAWLRSQSKVRLDGVMTHFASAEIIGSRQTAEQRARFEATLRQIAASGMKPTWIHAGNSSTLDNPEDSLCWLEKLTKSLGARVMVRSGLALYGYVLPLECEREGLESCEARLRSKLQPVMTWKTRVIGVREVERGTQIGYSGAFVAERRMRLALLPVGYADGLRRELSGMNGQPGGWVVLRGLCAPIVGRVSMNLTLVDVTSIDSIAVGDEVIVLGEGITAEDHARIAETIPYEILCGVKAARLLK